MSLKPKKDVDPKASAVCTYEEISSTHLSLLRILAVLPFEGRSLSFVGTRLLLIFHQTVNTIYSTMHLGYGVRMAYNHEFEIEYICEVVMVECLSLRYILMSLKRRTVADLLQTCHELWSNLTDEETGTVKIFEKKAHYYRNFFFWNGVAVVAMFMITAPFIRLPPITFNGTERKVLPFRFYVDVQEEPAYTIIFLIQGFVCFDCAIILSALESTGPFFILITSGYLRSIRNRLLAMAQQTTRNSGTIEHRTRAMNFNDVAKCIAFHQKILNFCTDIEAFTRSMFIMSVTGSAYNISLIGINLLKNEEYVYKFSSLMALNVMQLFICQWSPEQLLNESQAIANAAYFATFNEVNFDAKANKLLHLMMVRAQKPVQLTAGGFVNLSMETFGNMIKNALSFFTMVRNFNS